MAHWQPASGGTVYRAAGLAGDGAQAEWRNGEPVKSTLLTLALLTAPVAAATEREIVAKSMNVRMSDGL